MKNNVDGFLLSENYDHDEKLCVKTGQDDALYRRSGSRSGAEAGGWSALTVNDGRATIREHLNNHVRK